MSIEFATRDKDDIIFQNIFYTMSDDRTLEEKDETDAEIAPPPLSTTSSMIDEANDQARRTVIVAPDNGGPNDNGNDTTHKLTDILEEKKKTLMISTNPHAWWKSLSGCKTVEWLRLIPMRDENHWVDVRQSTQTHEEEEDPHDFY